MRYDYQCKRCEEVFEISHGMTETPIVPCPKCKSEDTMKVFLTCNSEGFRVKGYGWLDKSGARRDMNLHRLQNNDPYGHMRQPGEADDLANRLRNGGKTKKRKTIHLSKKGK